MKILWAVAGVSVAISGYFIYTTWNTQQENRKLIILNTLFIEERRILKDEIIDLERKPTYDQGYRDAIIRIGGPQNPGAYQDGWDDAIKIAGPQTNYADGYHAAVQQFGYSKTQLCRWMVPVPERSKSPTIPPLSEDEKTEVEDAKELTTSVQ